MAAAGRLRNGNPSRCDKKTRNNNKQIDRILFQYDNATFLAYCRCIQTLLPSCPNAHITKLILGFIRLWIKLHYGHIKLITPLGSARP
eukprot:8529739-Pyramimonas_sp.AAC.1